jgi:hypothetical protein
MEAKQMFPSSSDPTPSRRTSSSGLSDDEIKARANAWVDCAAKSASELDDGRSDAATIAESVRIACRKHYLPGDDDDRAYAIKVVLTLRSNQAKSKEPTAAELTAAAEKWADCVIGGTLQEDNGVAPPSEVADKVRRVCHHLFVGTPSKERSMVISAVEKIRASGKSRTPQIIVSPPQKMPPVDKRL